MLFAFAACFGFLLEVGRDDRCRSIKMCRIFSPHLSSPKQVRLRILHKVAESVGSAAPRSDPVGCLRAFGTGACSTRGTLLAERMHEKHDRGSRFWSV